MLERLFRHFVRNVVVKMLDLKLYRPTKYNIELTYGFGNYLHLVYRTNTLEELIKEIIHDFYPQTLMLRGIKIFAQPVQYEKYIK